MAQKPLGKVVLLRNPTVGVSDPKTPDDNEAIALLKELIHEVDETVELKIVPEPEGRTTPWLRSSQSFFRGLSEIKNFVDNERSLQPSS